MIIIEGYQPTDKLDTSNPPNEKREVLEVDLLEIFKMGVDYGQLIMEEERQRQGEGIFDAFLGSVFDGKFSMPMAQSETRQVHSEKWFEAKKKSQYLFIELMGKLKGEMKVKVEI